MNTHHTKSKGDLAALKAQLDLYQQGYWVATPLTENAPFDLMINKDGISKTVQVKFVSASNGVLKVSFRSSWTDKHGSHVIPIDKNAIDLYCVYCPDTDECYYFDPKIFVNVSQVNLRLIPAKNNQTKNVLWASDFRNIPLWSNG